MNHQDFKRELLKDPVSKAEYDALEPEYQLMLAAIDARESKNLTQLELAKLVGTSQANISKLENCELNPSIAFLKRFAEACDMKLTLRFQ